MFLSCWQAKQKRPSWLVTLVMATVLGLVTLAFVWTEHDMNEAISKLQHRLDHGSWEQTIERWRLGPDLASTVVGLVFFSVVWLLPVVIVGHYAADERRGLLCLSGIGMWASVVVLLIAIGSFTVVYFNTKVVNNALSWGSARTACIAGGTLVFCIALFLSCRGGSEQSGTT
ncbi:MAG: hypothetical protein ACYS18_02105 [Planctomycetota bacterium]|jgi:peptidoglycan/LPS O-acetylase OafA/YrhL